MTSQQFELALSSYSKADSRCWRDLTLHNDLRVHIEDTYATACHFLGIDLGSDYSGKPVTHLNAAQAAVMLKQD